MQEDFPYHTVAHLSWRHFCWSNFHLWTRTCEVI